MDVMKARAVGLVALAVLVAVGLTACARSGPVKPESLRNAPPVFSDLIHPHRFTTTEVKAAFAKQGISLREVRSAYGVHVVVLFDPRWHAPGPFQLEGGAPARTYFWVFVHAYDNGDGSQVGNVYVTNSPDEERSVDAALHTLYVSEKH